MIRTALRAALLGVSLNALPCAAQPLPHLDMEVELDPNKRAFRAAATVHLPARAAFDWQLARNLSVESVSVDGVTVEPEVHSEGELRSYRLSFGSAGARRVHMRYAGTLAPLDDTLDHRATLRGLPAVAAPQGSFLAASADWYPHPQALFTYRISVRTPLDQRAIVPGTRVSESEDGALRRVEFAFEQPGEGLDLMVGPYRVAERAMLLPGGHTVHLRTYFHAELAPLADDYLAASERYVRQHSAQIGDYPFEAFSVVSSPLPTGFGMPTLTYLGIRVLQLPFIRDTSLGHEVLHNWWGNGVYVDAARGNWSEGLTTFMADYAYRAGRDGASGTRDMRHGWLRDYAALAPGSEEALTEFTSRTHSASSAIGYGKAAMLFVMLEDQIGADAFAAGVRRFWEAQRFHQARFDHLRAAFEQASGAALAGFFDQWLERTGAPHLTLVEARARRSAAGTRLELTLDQGESAWALRVPLRIDTDHGAHDAVVAVDQRRQRVSIDLSGQPRAVRIDPDFRLWRQLLAGEAPPILRDAQTAGAPQVVVLGDEFLAAAAKRVLARFAEGEPRFVGPAQADPARQPTIVIGAHAPLAQWLAERGLAGVPAEVAGADVAVWAASAGADSVLMAIGLGDAPSQRLDALARRLPHLSQFSWLRIEGDKLAARGKWPAQAPAFDVPLR